MLAREGRGGAEQARLLMGNQLDRDGGHEILEAPLGDEAFGKARPHQMVADPKTEPARDHHAACSLRQCEVARDAAERQAEAFDRSRGQTVLLLHRSEEHTSELQSLMRISYAVFCLKKKKNKKKVQT